MKENNYIVYMHISPSNKRYIGITSQEPNRRWRSGNGYKHNEYFYRAINKYGWDNFQHIIIAEGLSEQDAIKIEEELIAKYDTTNRDKGYNILYKGDATTGLKGELHPLFNKNLSDEHRNKISETRIERGVAKGKNNPMFNKHHTEESKKKISEAYNSKSDKEKEIINSKISETRIERGVAKGKNNPSAKAVICITTNQIFDTMKEAGEYYKTCNTGISMCCKGKRKSAGKLEDGTPLVWMYLKDYLDDNKIA